MNKMNVCQAIQQMGIDDLRWFIYYHPKEFRAGYKKILAFLQSEYEPENSLRPGVKENK